MDSLITSGIEELRKFSSRLGQEMGLWSDLSPCDRQGQVQVQGAVSVDERAQRSCAQHFLVAQDLLPDRGRVQARVSGS